MTTNLTPTQRIDAALEIALDQTNQTAAYAHLAYAGYKPHEHADADADVQAVKDAIAAWQEIKADQAKAAPDGWQPISTVPNDETQILLRHSDGRILHAEWRDFDDCEPMWYGVMCGIGYDSDWEFTHWKNLPKEPQ